MDKKSILAISLIAIIMIIWMMYQSSIYEQTPPEQITKTDTSQVTQPLNDTIITDSSAADFDAKTILEQEKYGSLFMPFSRGEEELITINTANYNAIFTNRGGTLVSWELNNYNKWDGTKAQLINSNETELYMIFSSTEGKKIDTRELYFTLENVSSNSITLKDKDTLKLVYKLDIGNGKELVKTITLYADKYHIDQNIEVNNLEDYIRSKYSLVWGNNLPPQEKDISNESSYSVALISMNGNITEFDANEDSFETESYTGIIDYIAIKTKYFTTAVIPQPWQQFDGDASITGRRRAVNKDNLKDYQFAINVPYKGGKQSNSFKIFIGPIEYNLVRSYGLEATVDLGWRFLIRPIAEYVMLPFFKLIHNFIPNYGIAIIVFSLLMKILLTPLSIKQLRNASYMKLLQPEIEKRKKQAGDDAKKQQMATMEVYNQYGINPMNGCLPLLIQMPILFALWRTLNGFIELRQQPFILWINDLSIPDGIINWGFSILGMTQISGLALLMATTLFIQQKMTISDPNQKMLVYIMPLIFLFMFSNLPSGLNLYYFVFNLLAIGQQVYMNKFSRKRMTLEQLKNNPKKKEGWLAKQMRMAQEIQKQSGKPMPPAMQRYIDQKNKTTNTNSNTKNKNHKKKR